MGLLALAALAALPALAGEPLRSLAVPGGRPTALGGAYTALSDDAYAPAVNPAGLGFLKGAEGSAQFLERKQATLALPFLGSQGLGASLETSGRSDGSYALAYGRKAGSFGWGTAARLSETGDRRQASADFGGLYRLGTDLSFGLVAGGLGDSFTPRLGIGWMPAGAPLFSFEWLWRASDRQGGIRGGLEWRALGPLVLRAGLDSLQSRTASNQLGLTAGIGYDLGFSELSYAFTRDRQSLAAVVRFATSSSPADKKGPSIEEGPPTLYQAVPAN